MAASFQCAADELLLMQPCHDTCSRLTSTHNKHFTVPKSITLLPSATILLDMCSVLLSSDLVSP